MEVLSTVGYTEEVPLLGLAPGQYLEASQEAARQLHWVLYGWNNNSIIYQTSGSYDSQGEIITIIIAQEKVIFKSVPANEYYYDEQQNAGNASLFKEAMIPIAADRHKAYRSMHPHRREAFGALVPSKTYLVTPVILYINVLVFIAMLVAGLSPLHPTAYSLFQWGGISRDAVIDGAWWRLISYMFLHSGAMHLLMNAFALLYIGMFLEPLVGKFRFVSAYLLTGICAGTMSIVMHSNSVGVGASGAIFGMYGFFLALLTTSHLQKTARKTMLRGILFFIVFNLLSGIQGNIDNAAHIGGLVSGVLIGYAYFPGIKKNHSINRQVLVSGLLMVAIVSLVMLALSQLLINV